MPAFLGFSAEIRGVQYPAVAIFKLQFGAIFRWNGDHPTEGHLAIFDLVEKKSHYASSSWEMVHGSRLRDGGRHQTLELNDRRIHIAKYKETATSNLVSDSSIGTVTVPLLEPFFWWPMKTPQVWNAVKAPHLLRREDFGDNVDGVELHGYICRHDCVDDLLARFRTETHTSWVKRDDQFDLVVLAQVVRIQ